MTCFAGNYINKVTGYSQCRFKGKTVRQHRLAYCVAANIPLDAIKGVVVRHTCDIKWCVNPEHLILGTHQDNMDDMTSRNRQAKGVRIGNAVLTEIQVQFIRDHVC